MVDLKCCGLVLHLQHSCYRVHTGCKHAASSLSFALSALYLRSWVKPRPWFLCFAHHASVGACPVVVLVGAPSDHAFLLRFVYELSRRASWRQSRSEPGRTNCKHQQQTCGCDCMFVVCAHSLERAGVYVNTVCRFFLCFTCYSTNCWTKLHVNVQRPKCCRSTFTVEGRQNSDKTCLILKMWKEIPPPVG